MEQSMKTMENQWKHRECDENLGKSMQAMEKLMKAMDKAMKRWEKSLKIMENKGCFACDVYRWPWIIFFDAFEQLDLPWG